MRSPVRTAVVLAGLLLGMPALAAPHGLREGSDPPEESQGKDKEKTPFLVGVLTYLPNRVLDLLDIVRLRARVGPGVALGVRATETADLYAGVYFAGYVGLPGPRNRKLPKLPLGIESKTGVEVSKADVSTSLFLFDPDYGETEIGVDAHLLLVGAAVGIDPMELVDFLGGLVVLDPKHDDLGYPGPAHE